MKHKSGGKITRSHSTLIKAAAKIVRFLEKQPEVKKISLGVIRTFPGGRQNKECVVKISEELKCVKIGVTEGSSHQTLRFYFINGLDKLGKTELLTRLNNSVNPE